MKNINFTTAKEKPGSRVFEITKFLIICAVILTISLSILAQFKPIQMKIGTTATKEMTESATTKKEIRQILERYYEIARTNDRANLKEFSREISAPGYLYSSELGVMDKADTIKYFDSLDMKFVSAGFEELTIETHGTESAVAKYRDVSTIKMNGIIKKTPQQFTNFWVKQDGEWKIAAEHSNVIAPRELLPRNRLADDLAQK